LKSLFYILITFIFLISENIAAEPIPNTGGNCSISGFVRDSSNLETLLGATVYLEKTKYGAYTNKLGFYSITNIPTGTYSLKVTFIGYEEFQKKITLKKNQDLRLNIILNPMNVTTQVIEVEAEREIEKREISISKIDVPIHQIKNIRLGGESDVFRSLQYLPGVLTSSQISSGLYVRGGSPDQNLVLIDGSIVYNPSHLFGFISTFNTDAIKDVKLFKGGFPAEYGGRLSAVLDLTQKDGNRKEIEGVASLGVISSRLSLEGPLGNGSWFIGGRRTYFELIKAVLPRSSRNEIPDFNFYDINAKITQFFGDNDIVSLSGFISSDNFGFDNYGFMLDMGVKNQTVAGKWNHIFSEKLFSEVNISTSYYENGFAGNQAGYAFEIENSIRDITGKVSLDWFINESITLKSGLEMNAYDFIYFSNFTGNLDTNVAEGTNSPGLMNLNILDRNYALYSQLNYNFTDLVSLQGGLRLNYWDLSKMFLLDPRLSLKYIVNENLTLKAAWGIYSQDLRLATQPDFSFFDTWLPTDTSLSPARAIHYILSMQTDYFKEFDLNFDVYYKKMSNISELNNKTLSSESISSLFFVGNAEAYGAEIFLQRKFGKFSGWLGYGLGFIEAKFDSINSGQPFRPKYDRRHDFKIVAQYDFNNHWSVSATFYFQSGQSYTGASSQFQVRMPDDNIGRGKIVPTQRYGLRLPSSHQLNLTGIYSFKIGNTDAKIIIDIFNVYNHRDIWFRYYDTSKPVAVVRDVTLLPIIPTFAFEVKF
jgi:hypothetical protein